MEIIRKKLYLLICLLLIYTMLHSLIRGYYRDAEMRALALEILELKTKIESIK
jgi:hypothetical protein